MGLAPANGGTMAAFPLAILIIYAILGLLTLILRHSARGGVISGILFAPLLRAIGLRSPVLWIAGWVGLVVALRFLSDWKRTYREAWLDREKKTG